MKSSIETRSENAPQLLHCDLMQVTSHVQRYDGKCMLNTLMVDGYDCPFKYCRENKFRNLKGKQVDLSYYPSVEEIAGFQIKVMKVVQIKVN